jgi:transposase
MIFSGRRLRVFCATTPTDLRKSFDTLGRLVVADLGRDPLSGELFLFVNKRLNRAKVLWYDGTALSIMIKRLERGRFAAPWGSARDGVLSMSSTELSLFLEGSQLVFMGQLSPNDVLPKRVATRDLTIR